MNLEIKVNQQDLKFFPTSLCWSEEIQVIFLLPKQKTLDFKNYSIMFQIPYMRSHITSTHTLSQFSTLAPEDILTMSIITCAMNKLAYNLKRKWWIKKPFPALNFKKY